MGSGSWSSDSWTTYSSTTLRSVDGSKKSYKEVFKSKKLDTDLNPLKVKIRESCDSVEHPESIPVIIALDVTGSMHSVVHSCIEQLNKFITTAYDKKVIKDMHLMFMGIGDTAFDDAPVQMTQFESDIRIAEQLAKIYIESGGGGNNHESYIAAWYAAAKMTKTDSFIKRGVKGFLFTIGDEEITPKLTREHIQKFINDSEETSYTADELYQLVTKYYNVFHIVVEEGSHARSCLDKVVNSWKTVIGQHLVMLPNVNDLSEAIISTLQLANGMSTDEVIKDWDGSTAITTVKHVLKHLGNIHDNDTGIVIL